MHSLFSLSGGRVRRQSRELVTRYLQPGIRRGANRVLPSSWGTTIARLHMFQSDAGRTACTRPNSAAAWPLLIQRQRLPRWGLSTLNSMAFGLAVYASQGGLPQPPRKTRFRPLVRRYRTGFPPAGFQRKVSDLLPTSLPPFPSFLSQSHPPVRASCQPCAVKMTRSLV
jgi:hypothetical protein